MMMIFLEILLMLLLAKHLYILVSAPKAPTTCNSTLTLLTLPTPVEEFTEIPDISLLLNKLLPSLFCHSTVGTG